MPRKVPFFTKWAWQQNNMHAYENHETFHWYLTNLELLLCDLCVIYTRIFENQVSKKISLFYDLAI